MGKSLSRSYGSVFKGGSSSGSSSGGGGGSGAASSTSSPKYSYIEPGKPTVYSDVPLSSSDVSKQQSAGGGFTSPSPVKTVEAGVSTPSPALSPNFSSVSGRQFYASPSGQMSEIVEASPFKANISFASGGVGYVPPPSYAQKSAVIALNDRALATPQSSQPTSFTPAVKGGSSGIPKTWEENKQVLSSTAESVRKGINRSFLQLQGGGSKGDVFVTSSPFAASKASVETIKRGFSPLSAEEKSGFVGVGIAGATYAAPELLLASPALAESVGLVGVASKGRAAVSAVRSAPKAVQYLYHGAVSLGSLKAADVAVERATSYQVRDIKDFNEIFALSRERAEKPLKEEALYKQFAYEVSPFFSPSTKEYVVEEVGREASARGYSLEQVQKAQKAAESRFVYSGAAEAGMLLDISRRSELLGEMGVSKAFAKGGSFTEKQLGTQVFKKAFVPIAEAGAYEGGMTYLAQSSLRDRKAQFLPSSPFVEGGFDAEKLGFVGYSGFGAVSAGVIGGSIASLKLTKPFAGEVLEKVAYVSDPFEYPGDVAARASESVARRFGLPTIPSPKIISASVPSFSFGVSSPVSVPSRVMSPVSVPVSPFRVSVPTMVMPSVPITPDVPVTPSVPVTPNVPVTVMDIVSIPTDVFPDVPIQQNVNVPVSVPINVMASVPVTTPFLRIPPPVPFNFPVGSGSGASYSGRGKKYINELQAATSSLLKGIGGSPVSLLPSKAKKVKKRRKK